MKIEHQISPAFARHIQEVLAQIAGAEQQRLILLGKVQELQQEVGFMRRHLGVQVGLIEKGERLPPSNVPYELSADGMKLIGDIDPPQPDPEVPRED